MEYGARVVESATPRLAKLIQGDYVDKSARAVSEDFHSHHLVKLSRHYIQGVSKAVSQIIIAKESAWTYALPKELKLEQVKCVVVSRDGTTINIRSQGWRETMSGTISLYGKKQKLLHTIHVGTAPEYGKAAFNELMGREIDLLKEQLSRRGCRPQWIGIADGAVDNWPFLESITDQQGIDFYHVIERVGQFAHLAIPCTRKRKAWINEATELLLEQTGGPEKVYGQMQGYFEDIIDKEKQVKAQAHLTYFENQMHRMQYKYFRDQEWPIGSGVVEASCKTLVKQRFAQSGMRWHIHKADHLIAARALKLTPGRYDQFWKKYMKYAA